MVTPEVPSSVVTIMAHPDDAELWAGGTLACCALAGSSVTIAVPWHMERTRNAETITAAYQIGAAVYQFAKATADELRHLLASLRPEVVLTHALDDVHPEHRGIAATVTEALPDVVIDTGFPRRVYTCDTYNSLTNRGPVPAHTIVDITETFPTKIRALEKHQSQPVAEHFGPMAETLARLWGSRIGARYAENFVPLPILGRLPATTTL